MAGVDQYSKAQKDPNSLGNILLEMEYITVEQLEHAIKIQKSQSMLGHILLRNVETFTEEQLEAALLEQKIRRNRVSLHEMTKLQARKQRRLVSEVDNQFKNIASVFDNAGLEAAGK